MRMMGSKFIFVLLIFLSFVGFGFSSDIYNKDGDFVVETDVMKNLIYNDDIKTNYSFYVENKLDRVQQFFINIPRQSGWDIKFGESNFSLASGGKKRIDVKFEANSDFDYSTNVVSPDVIQISQQEDYSGYFKFPVIILGEEENVTMTFDVSIEKRPKPEIVFEPKLSSEPISPISPLKYTITAGNLEDEKNVIVEVKLGDLVLTSFNDTFTPNNNYKIYQEEVGTYIFPGEYNAMITVSLLSEDGKSSKQWYESGSFEVLVYDNLYVAQDNVRTVFDEKYFISIANKGNTKSVYEKEVEFGFFTSLLFGSNTDYEKTSNGVLFREELDVGESKVIKYTVNYIPIYVILVVLVVIVSYIYYRKTSNPLDVETKIYEVKKVEHEGVKSMKVRIGFENIKEHEIEHLKIVFRMPSYLNVKDNSFLLTEPNHVLKGKNQYKLIWDFKRFEQEDSRIIGFTLVNSKGVLGDVRIPNLEIEVKVSGKIRKYYSSFPIIRG